MHTQYYKRFQQLHSHYLQNIKDRTLKDELTRLVGAQYATGEEWRNNSRKNEEMEPKQKQQPVVDVTGEEVRSDAVRAILHRNLEC